MNAKPLVLLCIFIFLSASLIAQKEYTGSTPADPEVRTALNISQNANVDFIRWNLTFPRPRKFALNIVYGESQPNTLGFKSGGTKATFEGSFEMRVTEGVPVYTLKTGSISLSLKMLNDYLLHILTRERKLMVGNGGWNYILTQKNSKGPMLPFKNKTSLKAFADSITVFEGRTPCQEIAKEYDFPATSECFKLKWLLTFTKGTTYHSGTFSLNRTLSRANLIKGTWTIDSTGKIELNPENGQKVLLVAGDENVLFFTDKSGALFDGNENFSYALNRRRKNP